MHIALRIRTLVAVIKLAPLAATRVLALLTLKTCTWYESIYVGILF